MFIISPFIWIIKNFYALNLSLMGSHGWSLILLSLEITVVMLPFYYLAEKWKRDEERIQDTMNPAMESVKEAYGGQKRHYLIREVHRIFGYKSWYSLRVTMGLLIQIPLFMAAYIYLSEYPGYRGVSFGILKNLAAQDGIAWGVNIMPFIMTAVNLIASFLYAKGSKRSDKIQLVVMALLFLVLLYDRPCGLVLYWTMNNLFGLPKNLWLKRVCPPIPVYEEPFSWKSLKPQVQSTMLASIAILLIIISSVIIDDFTKYSRYWLILCALLAGVITVLYIGLTIKRTGIRSLFRSALSYVLLILWAVYLYLLFDWMAGGFIEANFPTRPKRLFITIISFSLSYLCAAAVLVKERELANKANPKNEKLGFLVSTGLLYYLFLLYSPLQTFSYAAVELKMTLGGLLLTQGVSWIILTLLTFFIYTRLSQRGKSAIKQAILFILVTSIVYYFFLRKDYGALSGNTLSGAELLYETSFLWFLFDAAILTGAFYLTYLMRNGRGREIFVLSFIVLIGLFCQNTFSLIQSSGFIKLGKEMNEEHSIALPPESEKVHTFTKTGTNTLLIVGDMFTAGLMEPLLEENPKWLEQLDGFTWYPDTLSVATSTYTAMPAILGGWNYSPLILNERPGTTLEKNYEAYDPLLYTVAEKGGAVSLSNPEVFDMKAKEGVTVTKYDDYVSYWNSKHTDEVYILSTMNPKRLLTVVGMFYGSPHFCRKSIYSKGYWSIFPTKNALDNIHRNVKSKWVYLDLLPELSHVTNDNITQVKYIHNNLPHLPYGIDPNGKLVRVGNDGLADIGYYSMEAAYYSAREFIDKLIIWFDWMKSEGVYDNTQIVIVSDHGVNINGKDPMEPQGFADENMSDVFAASHALLMFKPAYVQGDLEINPALMSNADCFSLLAPLLDIPVHEEKPDSRYYAERAMERRDIPQAENVMYNTYRVEGSIFEINNWSLQEP